VSGPLRFSVEATDGDARAGWVTTPRGRFATPCFMPVGTRAAVRTLTAADLEDLGAEVVLANTYHLMLRPGADVVAAVGGLHRFMGYSGHLLTDSGGYQVFSLSAEVDDDGVTFRSTYDGSRHRLTPEGAVALQEALGADIQMTLDVCPPLPSPPEVVRAAVVRTAAWAARARAAHRREGQALFGIVQGGVDPVLRRDSARRTVDIGFDGYGIGGLSVGEARDAMLGALAVVTGELPADRPRYLMGVGDPAGLLDAIACGVDMFDCVLPTRLARHATVLTAAGRLHLRNAAFARDDGPIDPACGCAVCRRWSRAYVRHLFVVGEPAAARLATLHNLAWVLGLVRRARDAIAAGTFGALRATVAASHPPAAPGGGRRVGGGPRGGPGPR
jgi:queuine tRNA-ribosyltransferase